MVELGDHWQLCITIGIPSSALLIAAMPDGKIRGSAVQLVTPPPPPPGPTVASFG